MEGILDAALMESMDLLKTGKDCEMKLRNVRSLSGGVTSRRHEPSGPGTSAACYRPTKENTLNQLGKTMLYCASSSNSKMYYRRQKYRSFPYDISTRKPLHSLLNPMGRFRNVSSVVVGSSRVRSSGSYSEDYKDNTLPVVFDEEYQDLQFREGLMYRKTDQFPVPILSRSKSLEDLRETPSKLKSKQVRFQLVHHDDNSNGTASSNGSSVSSNLSPSSSSFFNILKGEASIKNEIDSMSMLIEKLDVA